MGQDLVVEIPPLPDTTILMVEVGSTAHGTGIPGGEDHDQLAVVIEDRGYMQSQTQRLLGLRGGGHGKRGGGQREELVAKHGFDTEYAMHCSRLGFQCIELLTTGRLSLPIQGEPADWLRAVRAT